MRYPEFIKVGDTIGICAPSCGIEEEKRLRLDAAESQLQELGYKIIETNSVRTDNLKGRSTDAKTRAKEFMELYENDDVKLIIFATGGDYLCEMLDYLDFEYLRTLKPKWLQGYSDCTGLGFLFNTILDIPTMYHQTIKDFAMRPLHECLVNDLKILSGEVVEQDSFDMCEEVCDMSEDENKDNPEDPYKGYDLQKVDIWKNLRNEDVIEFEGRSIGGCLDCILSFIGTKYDNIKNYLENHKEDGFIWFFDCFELGSSALFRTLWQMKNAGYFKYCNGIVFGRPLFTRDDYDITFNESILEAIGELNIPIIVDADIGHVSPQMAVVNGGYLKFISKEGKGKLITKLI